ncbi:uncharacterized protein ARMOST_02801 [Armillaria ostoyae]|uniref:T-cell immunomodulatory protein TIP C2 domain-containing protein n=1 Tax=Armillaria ostoyae TaxID=47428 RepID=A0A284QSP7_ARMOS|nr:uncharacterized protein ARMOST_02801 [Armillaria ostoyae]
MAKEEDEVEVKETGEVGEVEEVFEVVAEVTVVEVYEVVDAGDDRVPLPVEPDDPPDSDYDGSGFVHTEDGQTAEDGQGQTAGNGLRTHSGVASCSCLRKVVPISPKRYTGDSTIGPGLRVIAFGGFNGEKDDGKFYLAQQGTKVPFLPVSKPSRSPTFWIWEEMADWMLWCNDPARKNIVRANHDVFFLKAIILKLKYRVQYIMDGVMVPLREPNIMHSSGHRCELLLGLIKHPRYLWVSLCCAKFDQLSQTSYHALQSPYSFFGLGRTNNYIENLFVGSTMHVDEHYMDIEGVIPNSKVDILPG